MTKNNTPTSLPTTISEILDEYFPIEFLEVTAESPEDKEKAAILTKIAHYKKTKAQSQLLAAFEKHLLSLPSMQMEYRETLDMGLSSWTNEDFKAFGRNELRTQLIKENKEASNDN